MIIIIIIIIILSELVSIIMFQDALKKYIQIYSTCGTSMWYEWMPMITIATNLTHETMATCQPVHQLVEINMEWKMILVGKKKQNHVTTSKNAENGELSPMSSARKFML